MAKKKITKKVVAKKRATKNVPAVRAALPVTREQVTAASALKAFDMLGITSRLDANQKMLFIELAVRNNLDPLKREIHAVERNQKVTTMVPGKGEVTTYVKILTPVTGYEVFIDRAEESGRLQYWGVQCFGNTDESLHAVLTIKRKDWPKEFSWTCWYSEVSAGTPIWSKDKHHMLEKTTISRGFRLCFRDVLRGMPYTVEEIETIDVTPEKPALIEPQEVRRVEAQPEPPRAEPTDTQQLIMARAELQKVFRACVDSKKYEKEELAAKRVAATIATDNLQGLQDMITAWQIDMSERKPKT